MPDQTSLPHVDHSPAGRHRLAYLDEWRGLSLLMVLAGHFAPFHLIDFGTLGVEMFLVLSGRLMADILFIERLALPSFFVRRIARVWPGLAFYVLFCGLVFADAPDFLHATPAALLAAAFFLTNYRSWFDGQTQILDHTWSLGVEEHGYVVLAMLALALRGQGLARVRNVLFGGAALLAANGLVESAFIHTPLRQMLLYWRSDVRIASLLFAAGLYVQFAITPARPGLAPLRRIWAPLALGLLCFIPYLPMPLSYTLGTALLAYAVCGFERLAPGRRGFVNQGWLAQFGLWSYSIYLWQQPVFKIFQWLRAENLLGTAAGLLTRPLFVAAAILLGLASFYLVEQPARRAINRHFAAPSPAPGAPVLPGNPGLPGA